MPHVSDSFRGNLKIWRIITLCMLVLGIVDLCHFGLRKTHTRRILRTVPEPVQCAVLCQDFKALAWKNYTDKQFDLLESHDRYPKICA